MTHTSVTRAIFSRCCQPSRVTLSQYRCHDACGKHVDCWVVLFEVDKAVEEIVINDLLVLSWP